MSDSFQQDADLRHYGVLGMKWGKTRAKATGKEIRTARKDVNKTFRKLNDADDAVSDTRKGTPERAKAQADYKRLDREFAKDPKRAIAVRMTNGEKIAAVILTGPVGLIPVVGTDLISRRIEQKQDLGKYDK